ncbi:Hypothetical protein LOCK908_1531 [Lacticaseibacillus rhamnosus LOCK908]|uniref:Uncharacterized protein n=1 Tax=Lacticaseibacillus rhamnosus (strain LMS2-1) TaxID=525361 RepID=C2JX90_LACRM|nr:conserved hypothetical protein [Lacticaseibacillus rhamnosus ATCC 8530]AGP74170.1 Hypothetical protein LOCK908_1531 [Lacticaseibacillus rhamnosus LOCK908]EEN80346.1 hypothetical protein HMPREF0539_1524 [Lacticaseibacillus rhamnosus LMS2-1]
MVIILLNRGIFISHFSKSNAGSAKHHIVEPALLSFAPYRK